MLKYDSVREDHRGQEDVDDPSRHARITIPPVDSDGACPQHAQVEMRTNDPTLCVVVEGLETFLVSYIRIRYGSREAFFFPDLDRTVVWYD
jgi:hypothetical protein